ncbi:MAG: hypothetical protein J6W28_02385 [Clostridia bacterium]|nr:hypothetical protein [Clostridia bacterium]
MNDEREPRAPDLSGILSQISSNPNAMAMLGSLLGNVSPPVKHPEASTDSCACKEILPPKASASFEDRKRLLLALKPFLSPERCQTVDMLLMILEAFSAFQKGKRNGPCT